MPAYVKSQTATLRQRNGRWLSGSRTAKAASGSTTMQTESAQDDYDRKVSLINRAFNEIARLVFEYDLKLTDEDWAAIDQARLDDPTLSFDELRERLVALYRRIKRACQAVRP
uniref:Uncharacterized protein n=1 Tax=Acetithermum autotrophicum TaxID=1446466 RepID=H5STV6_ACEAU|nr:hypothetical protein HGMM_OP4C592 [Candidatus Acetothermum autotrophicum]